MLIQQELSCLLALVTTVVQALPALGPHDGPLLFPNPPGTAPPANRSSGISFGNRQFDDDDDDVCHNSHTCKDRGKRYWDQLIATVSQPNPIDRTDGPEKFREYYRTQIAMLGDRIEQLDDDLENHGFETRNIRGWATFSMNPHTGEETVDTAYRNLFYTFKGLIIAAENFRDADEQKKLPWSELMYMTWKSAEQRANLWHDRDPVHHPGGGPISTLQTVVSAKCVNEETQAVIKEIWDAQGLEWNTGDPMWYKYTLGELAAAGRADWFYALVGTDNVKGAVWLLNDHAAEIGRKIITEIWVRWTWVDPDIWINIGPYMLDEAVSVA